MINKLTIAIVLPLILLSTTSSAFAKKGILWHEVFEAPPFVCCSDDWVETHYNFRTTYDQFFIILEANISEFLSKNTVLEDDYWEDMLDWGTNAKPDGIELLEAASIEAHKLEVIANYVEVVNDLNAWHQLRLDFLQDYADEHGYDLANWTLADGTSVTFYEAMELNYADYKAKLGDARNAQYNEAQAGEHNYPPSESTGKFKPDDNIFKDVAPLPDAFKDLGFD